MEARARLSAARPYLGMSAIGQECGRALWYSFRWAAKQSFGADTLKRFEDGHASEDVQADRLRLVPGLTLLTIDPDTGRQWGCIDHGGHFRGHADGAVQGLLQAPKTWHVWEHKACDEKKLVELEKAKRDFGEKGALKAWNATYYAQAVLYMHYLGLDRHYLTASSPGGRRTISVRTEADEPEALRLIERARGIIESPRPLTRIGDATHRACRWCSFAAACHEGEGLETNCRTCLHATARIESGDWHCARWNKALDEDTQRAGCPAHLFIPDLIAGEQIDAGEDWVEYRMPDGSTWRDGARP
jgi:hypothetical protein